mmetsp:Transcript_25523/g.51971  ORF Transcript_25523/g.51971 Transcript_25523/m.51971 type:complete len:143 (-) Transcript_25523:297-725(-)
MESLCSVISATFGTHISQRLEQAFDLPSCDCAEYVAAVPNTMTDADQGRGLAATQAMVRLLKAGTLSAVGKRRMFVVLVRESVLARKRDRISVHHLRSNIPLSNNRVLFGHSRRTGCLERGRRTPWRCSWPFAVSCHCQKRA